MPIGVRIRTIYGVENPPRILAIETSSRIGGVALGLGAEIVDQAYFRADHNHAVELLPTIDRLCRGQGWSARDLHHLYLSIGPGSFTGLRIAVSLARALAWSVGLNIVALPTLEVIAQNALAVDSPAAHLAVVLDAKRQQIYAATFELRDGKYLPISDARVVDPLEFFRTLPRTTCILGEGISYHRDALAQAVLSTLPEASWPPRVEALMQLAFEKSRNGCFSEASSLCPIYLRRPEAEEVWEARHGSGVQPAGGGTELAK